MSARCPGCGHTCCPHPGMECGGDSNTVLRCERDRLAAALADRDAQVTRDAAATCDDLAAVLERLTAVYDERMAAGIRVAVVIIQTRAESLRRALDGAGDEPRVERCRICGGSDGKHDGSVHDARVADMPTPAEPAGDEPHPTHAATGDAIGFMYAGDAPNIWVDDGLLGGMCCADCGMPTESMPCADHQPEAAGPIEVLHAVAMVLRWQKHDVIATRVQWALSALKPLRFDCSCCGTHFGPCPTCMCGHSIDETTEQTVGTRPSATTENREACPSCGRLIATFVPAGGDRTVALFREHGPRDARCPGSGRVSQEDQ